jgi:hypothetical protein
MKASWFPRMPRSPRAAWIGAAAVLVQSGFAQQSHPQPSPDGDATLRERMLSLEARLAAVETAPQDPAPPGWADLSVGGHRWKLYGFARVDVQRDDSRPNNTQTIGWILSEDDAAPPGVGAGGDDREDLTIHARLTRVGLDVDGGKVASLSDAAVTGKVEIDFYNNGLAGQSESRAALRMRHAWLKLAWSRCSILFGQTNDVISPIFPIVNSDLVMWGAGNLGDRRPQVRVEYATAPGDGVQWAFQGAVGLAGADDNQDLDPAGTFGAGYRDGETSGLPTLQARVAGKFEVRGRATEAGVWFHHSQENPDGTFGGESRFDSEAIGADLTLPLFRDDLTLKAEVWQGENLDDVRGGIFQGVNSVTGDEIEARGGFIEVGWAVTPHLSLYAGWSNDNPVNDDLNAGGRAENQIAYVASRWNYKPVHFGLEVLDWTTKYVGFDEGDDLRIAGFAAFNF